MCCWDRPRKGNLYRRAHLVDAPDNEYGSVASID